MEGNKALRSFHIFIIIKRCLIKDCRKRGVTIFIQSKPNDFILDIG